MASRATRTLANLALLLASSLAGLALCEAGLRLLHPKYQHLAEAAFVRDPALIYSPVPGHCGTFTHPDTEARHSVCHNNLGLRQHRDFSAIDLESSVNIAFFGDSFTENVQVPAQHSFTEPLDYLLNFGGSGEVNVLNFGVGGYGTGQSLLRYEASSVREHLSHVFYVYFENDLFNDQATGLFRLNDAGELERSDAAPAGAISLLSRLHLSYLVLAAFDRLSWRLGEAEAGAQAVGGEYWDGTKGAYADGLPQGAYSVFRQLLRRWKQAAEGLGASFRLLWLPMEGYDDPGAAASGGPLQPLWGPLKGYDARSVASIVKEEGVETIDLRRCFAEHDPAHLQTSWRDSPYRFKRDAHWNEAGNRLAAVCLYRFLEENLGLPKLSEADLQEALRQYYSTFEASGRGALAGQQAVSSRAKAIREKYRMVDLYGSQWRDIVRKLASKPEQAIIRSDFDVHRHGRWLVYVKDGGCGPADFKEKFLLHLMPVDKEDLPPDRLQYGFDNRDFFAVADEATCSVTVRLPSYPIESIRTGQFVSGEEGNQVLWYGERSMSS